MRKKKVNIHIAPGAVGRVLTAIGLIVFGLTLLFHFAVPEILTGFFLVALGICVGLGW